MLEIKVNKKYDFFELNSELEIPNENIINENENDNKDLDKTSNLDLEPEFIQYNNKLKIEHSTFIIKTKNIIHLIFSINKDLPVKIEKSLFFSIQLSNPILQVISFMPDSKDESIIISTGDSLNNIEVLQIELKKLMHKYSYNKLNFIKNALKIIPIKDSLVLILHFTNLEEGKQEISLKLWKNFNEEIYNFKKVYNFAYNFENNKIICIDNKVAPFTFSIYPFSESYFNKNKNDIVLPEFYISLSDYIKNTEENDIEIFIFFESFSNIICFWAKYKNIESGYLLSIIFVDFKGNKCFDYLEFNYKAYNKYFFKINQKSKEIYLFNLSQELLYIYSFKKQDEISRNDLYITKIHFTGNIKGVDFTENNGLVILTEQNNLICYSKNENIFTNFQKQYIDENIGNDFITNNNLNLREKQKLNNNINQISYNKVNKNDKIIDIKVNKIHNINKIIDNNEKKIDNQKIFVNQFGQVDTFCQTEKNNLDEDEDEKENIDNIQIKKKEKETTLIKLTKNYKIFNEIKEIKNKFYSVQFEKLLLIKLIKQFKKNIINLEKNYIQKNSESDLNEKFKNIEIDIKMLNKNIEDIEKNINSEFDRYVNLHGLNYFLFEEKLNIIDEKNIKNKIIEIHKDMKYNNKNIYDNEDDNDDYESLELIDKSLGFELENKKYLKNKIVNILSKCNSIKQKINIICERNGNIKYNNNKLNILLNYCKNDINIICEMYKYNKFSKKEETKFIYGLINPLINFYNLMKDDLEAHFEILEKELKNSFKVNNETKIHLLSENNYLKNVKDNKNKEHIEDEILQYLEDIFEENKFYIENGMIITHYCINLDDDFKI